MASVRRFLVGQSLALALLALGARASWGCSIPVFRYALERWPAEPYLALVFHKGPLGAEEQKLVDALSKAPGANLEVQAAEVQGKMEKDVEAVLKREGDVAVPWVVLLYPPELRIEEKAWSGPLTAETAKAIVDSPGRREVARRLVAGDCAVWVLVESGDKAKDAAAAKLIGEELKKLEKTLELPSPDLGGGGFDDPALAPEARQNLKVAFSLVRVSRADKAEQVLVNMLVGVDAEFRKEKEPMAFAVFGQGRALPPLIGAGIEADNLAQVCGFVVGPCSCQVKAMNPGWDLLIATDWSGALEGREVVKPPEPPPLTGSVPTRLPKEKDTSVAPQPTDAPAAKAGGQLLRNMLLAVVAGVVILAVASVVVLRRRSE
jgi:hypothetical protein